MSNEHCIICMVVSKRDSVTGDPFCDADYVGDTETRRSTTENIIKYCNCPISGAAGDNQL